MLRHALGQARAQEPHWTQRKGSMAQVRAFFSTVMAWQGQVFWQMPHRMHRSTSLTMWPLSPAGGVLVSRGYRTV